MTLSEESVAVAVNVVLNAPERAITELAPLVDPSVHAPAVAMPLASVVCAPPAMLPPPDATEKLTLAPATGPPRSSVIRTLSGVGTEVETGVVCASPAALVMTEGSEPTKVTVAVCDIAAPSIEPVTCTVRGDALVSDAV